jgi:hypothetical protein
MQQKKPAHPSREVMRRFSTLKRSYSLIIFAVLSSKKPLPGTAFRISPRRSEGILFLQFRQFNYNTLETICQLISLLLSNNIRFTQKMFPIIIFLSIIR